MKTLKPTHYLISVGTIRPNALARVIEWNPKDAAPGMVEIEALIPGAPYGVIHGFAHKDQLMVLEDSNEAFRGVLDAPTGE